jgi:3-keto-disaccharide hydrolase
MMSRLIALFLIALTSGAATYPSVQPGAPAARDVRLIGRWDITITTPAGSAPSWLEIDSSGREALVGRIVGIVGSVRPISEIITEGDSLRFAVPRQWEDGNGELRVVGRLQGDRLVGRMTFPDNTTLNWQGVRAPRLERPHAPAWGAPIRLLNQNNLNGWEPMGSTNQWLVSNGVLSSPRSGVNLRTSRAFGDFKLHIEFRYPRGSNSGVYLRGRHELQIEDDYGREPDSHRFSGIYGFISPSEIAARPAGQWQTYDITLVGRMITVVANGKMVICNQEIPGITGGALDSNEGEPGPLYLQGDHGPIDYRNIIVTPGR